VLVMLGPGPLEPELSLDSIRVESPLIPERDVDAVARHCPGDQDGRDTRGDEGNDKDQARRKYFKH